MNKVAVKEKKNKNPTKTFYYFSECFCQNQFIKIQYIFNYVKMECYGCFTLYKCI